MCPACIENTALIVVGAASTGGVLAVCINKIMGLFKSDVFGLHPKTKEK